MELMEALEHSIEQSTISFQTVIGGETAALWGYRRMSTLGSVVQVWMLSTPVVDQHPTIFGRMAVREFHNLMERYATLVVHVHEHHTLARKWLKRLGFVDVLHVGEFIEMRAYREGHNPWARS